MHGEREDADMKQELGFHLDMETEKNLAAGPVWTRARRGGGRTCVWAAWFRSRKRYGTRAASVRS